MADSHYIADSAPLISFHLPFSRRSNATGVSCRIPRFGAGNPAAGKLFPVAVPYLG